MKDYEAIIAHGNIIKSQSIKTLLQSDFNNINNVPNIYAIVLGGKNIGTVVFFHSTDFYTLIASGLLNPNYQSNFVELKGHWSNTTTVLNGATIGMSKLNQIALASVAGEDSIIPRVLVDALRRLNFGRNGDITIDSGILSSVFTECALKTPIDDDEDDTMLTGSQLVEMFWDAVRKDYFSNIARSTETPITIAPQSKVPESHQLA